MTGEISSRAVSGPSRPEGDTVAAARAGVTGLSGLLLIGLAATSWGTTGSVVTILVTRADASPILIGAVRVLLAAVVLVAFARTGPGPLGRPAAWRCLAMGACMAAYQVTYFTAVTLTGIVVTALIAICSAPLMIAALAAALLGERLTTRVAAALGLGVVGTALLIAGARALDDLSTPFGWGLLLAVGAGLAYALYVVLAKASLAHAAPVPLAAATFAAAALFLLPALALPGAAGQIALGWPWLVYLGVVTTAGGYACYTVGLRSVPASVAGIVTLLEPLTATALGTLLFGERLGITGLVGAALLLAAFAVLPAGGDRPATAGGAAAR